MTYCQYNTFNTINSIGGLQFFNNCLFGFYCPNCKKNYKSSIGLKVTENCIADNDLSVLWTFKVSKNLEGTHNTLQQSEIKLTSPF